MPHPVPHPLPGPAPARPDPPSPGPLLDAVAAELRTRRWHLGFAPEVEARYERDRAAARSRSLLRSGLLALAVYDLFLINDLLVRPEVMHQALLWRLAVMTPFGLAMLVAVRRGLPARWREGAMASSLVAAIACSSMILWHTRSAAANYDLFMFSLVFMAGNIVFPLPFVQALASSLLCLALAAGLGIAHPTMPPGALPFALDLLAGTAVFSVLACHRIEHAARQSYLLLLREALHAQAAQQQAQAFARLSNLDALTELANRRAFDEALQWRWAQAAAARQSLSLLIVDVDHFKPYNDHFGHPAGDACLRRIAGALRDGVRDGDLVARLGGEEFGVLLPDASREVALAAAERLRQAVQALALAHDGQAGRMVVTVSVGAAQAEPAVGGAPSALVAAADAALYQAKRQGRNRCASPTAA